MIAAFTGYDGTLYKLLLLVHIASIVSAFGPMLLQQALLKRARTGTSEQALSSLETGRFIVNKLAIPGMIAAVVAGIALVGASDQVIGFDQTWISMAFVVVIVLLVLAYFLLRPAFVEMIDAVKETGSTTSDAAKAVAIRLNATCGVFNLGFLVILALMLFQPGR